MTSVVVGEHGSTTRTAPDADVSVLIDGPKLVRLASMIHEVLEESRRMRGEAQAVERLRHFDRRVRTALAELFPEELAAELEQLSPDVEGGSLEELILGQAEILGWLEGFVQGTELALQMAAVRALGNRRAAAAPQTHADDGAPYL